MGIEQLESTRAATRLSTEVNFLFQNDHRNGKDSSAHLYSDLIPVSLD